MRTKLQEAFNLLYEAGSSSRFVDSFDVTEDENSRMAFHKLVDEQHASFIDLIRFCQRDGEAVIKEILSAKDQI